MRWGDQAEVQYGPNTWPVWGNDNVVAFLESQRDLYKYMHDQSLRLANQGLAPAEAAEVIELPPALGQKWHNRYYHGSLHHNVRAVFNQELGHRDGDPASVWPLPRSTTPKGTSRTSPPTRSWLKATRRSTSQTTAGQCRFCTTSCSADPDNIEAKNLQADAYEQLGYLQDIPQWRGIFLTAAMGLRQGVNVEGSFSSVSPDVILNMPTDLLWTSLPFTSSANARPTWTSASTSPSPSHARRCSEPAANVRSRSARHYGGMRTSGVRVRLLW